MPMVAPNAMKVKSLLRRARVVLPSHMCDGFRALAAVSPGCLATVVKSHRTYRRYASTHPLNALQMAALRAAI